MTTPPVPTATDEIVAANAAHAAAYDPAAAGFDPAVAPPSRLVAVVTCMDARIDPAAAFGLRPGQAHVVRNAGGIVTEDVLRSLTLSQRELGTVEVAVVQHTGCGLLGLDDAAVVAAIEAETGAPPPFAPGGFPDLEASVRAGLATLRSAPFLPWRDAVRGFVYDVATGRLREVA
ncbi:MAG TPA: carbonic anhydrase [Acidimicrobiales bacterium]|nr:carbonic anhydrase [Acidimicrobiales bacterium]